MAKLHLKSDMAGNFIAPDKVVSKAKPRDVVDITIAYRLERDRVIWKTTKDNETIEALKKKYNL